VIVHFRSLGEFNIDIQDKQDFGLRFHSDILSILFIDVKILFFLSKVYPT